MTSYSDVLIQQMAREQLRDLATLDELLPAGMGTVVEKVDQTVKVKGEMCPGEIRK